MSARRASALLIAAAALLLSWAAAADSPPAAAPATADTKEDPAEVPVDVQAERMYYDTPRGVTVLEGHVIADRAGARLRAARGRLDRAKGELVLEGGVVAAQSNQIVVADRAVIDLRSRAADLEGAVLYVKDGAPDLLKLADAQLAKGLGKNSLTARAKRVEQGANGVLLLRDVIATPCDCAAQPDYELLADSARVADDRATLHDVHLRLLGATLPLFPVTLPLLDRMSGMLAPQISFTQFTGFRLAQPIYLVLDRSWDLTLTPGIYSGALGGSSVTSRSLQGPRLAAEVRWMTAEWNRGELAVDLVQDLKAGDSPVQTTSLGGPLFAGEHAAAAGRGFGGLRGTLTFAERLGAGAWFAAAEGAVASDSRLLYDAPAIVSYPEMLRTDVGVWRAWGPVTAGGAAVLLQDLRISDTPDRRLFGPEARATLQRLPSPFVQLAPVLLGPVTLGAEASAASFATFAKSSRERATGFGVTDLGAGAAATADPAGADQGRATALRFDIAPQLGIALPPGSPVRGRLLVGGRADAWLFDNRPERNARRLQGTTDVEASLLLGRQFGNDLLHTLEPQLQIRAVSPALLGGGPPPGDPADGGSFAYLAAPGEAEQGLGAGAARLAGTAGTPSAGRIATQGVPAARRGLDELDGSAPSTGGVGATVGVRNTLWSRPSGQGLSRMVWLLLQQDLVLWNGTGEARAADAVAALGFGLPWLSFTGDLRWDWPSSSLSGAGGGLRVWDARGDAVTLRLQLLRGAAIDRIHAGVDELFATTRLAALAGNLGGSAGAGVTWALPTETKGLALQSDVGLAIGDLPADAPSFTWSESLNWRPPCGCAALGAGVDLYFRSPAFGDGKGLHYGGHFTFELRSLGR